MFSKYNIDTESADAYIMFDTFNLCYTCYILLYIYRFARAIINLLISNKKQNK